VKISVKDSITEDELRSGLNAVIKDGLASQAMATFTGGIFLVAFALHLGASNTIIGILAAIPPLAQLLQIPAIYLVEKIRLRKPICVYASLLSRVFWILIALIPFLFSPKVGLMFLVIAMTLHSSFGAVSFCSWNSWLRDLIPQEQLGSFFSRRMRLSMGVGIVLSLAAGFYIDYWKELFPKNELYGYSILFIFGFVAGLLGVYYISTIPELRMEDEKKIEFFNLISKPFKDVNFKNLILFAGSWNFAINLAAPFFTVYMLKKLDLDMFFIIALTVMSQMVNFTFLSIWGKFSDRFSNKSVLGVSGPLFLCSILAWSFTTLPEKHLFTVPLLVIIHIFMGISMAGVTLASGNIGLKLAPKGEATAYLAALNIITSIAAGLAPIIGGKFADVFAGRELSLVLKWTSPVRELAFQTLSLQHWDFFFFFAFIIGLYSIHRLTMVKELGEVKEKVVVSELIAETKREMRNLSSIGGLGQTILFPFSILKNLKAFNNHFTY
jgi:MFS family permease